MKRQKTNPAHASLDDDDDKAIPPGVEDQFSTVLKVASLPEINSQASLRGILEMLYHLPKRNMPSKREFGVMVSALFVEAGALCAGALCAWCLHAIPNPVSSQYTRLHNPVTEIYPEGIEHYITGSKRRCACVNYEGLTRDKFVRSQSLFFLTARHHKVHMVLEKAIVDQNQDLILAAFQYITKQYCRHHCAVKSEDKARFIRAVRYCSNMTTMGLKCDMCGVRRVDIEPYVHIGGHQDRWHRDPLAVDIAPTEIDAMEKMRNRVVYDGKILCFECTYGLLRPHVSNSVVTTSVVSSSASHHNDTVVSGCDWDLLTQDLDEAIALIASAPDPIPSLPFSPFSVKAADPATTPSVTVFPLC